jgi:cytochrome c biogenesis protein
MLPLELSDKYLFSGVRTSAAEPFSYLHIPLDASDGDSAATWFAIRQLFFDPARHAALAERFTARVLDANDGDEARRRLRSSAEQILARFARGGPDALPASGEEDRAAAFFQMLQGMVWDAWMSAREAAGQSALEPGDAHAPFIRDALIAMIDSQRHDVPLTLQLTGYEFRQASILQATRAPGKPLVYLGSLLLALGVFAMRHIRERRLFVLLKDDEALVAMSSNRKTLDVEEAFVRHCHGLAAASPPVSRSV